MKQISWKMDLCLSDYEWKIYQRFEKTYEDVEKTRKGMGNGEVLESGKKCRGPQGVGS